MFAVLSEDVVVTVTALIGRAVKIVIYFDKLNIELAGTSVKKALPKLLWQTSRNQNLSLYVS